MNLVHVLRETSLPDGLDVVSLPDWLARACGEATGLGDPTMLAGTALYDLDAAPAACASQKCNDTPSLKRSAVRKLNFANLRSDCLFRKRRRFYRARWSARS